MSIKVEKGNGCKLEIEIFSITREIRKFTSRMRVKV